MGSFFFSMHFKTDDAESLRAAADAVISAAEGRMYIAQPAKGWISTYPDEEVQDPMIARRITAKAKVEHAIVFCVHDSDAMYYWYFRNGKLADSFATGLDDDLGKVTKQERAAAGDANAFTDLLDKKDRPVFAKLIGRRSINGKVVGRGPEFVLEDERLEKIAKLLKISGASTSYRYLEKGESIPGVGSAKDMTRIGAAGRKAAHKPRVKVLKVTDDGTTTKVGDTTFHLSSVALRVDSSGKVTPINKVDEPAIFGSAPARAAKSKPRSTTKRKPRSKSGATYFNSRSR